MQSILQFHRLRADVNLHVKDAGQEVTFAKHFEEADERLRIEGKEKIGGTIIRASGFIRINDNGRDATLFTDSCQATGTGATEVSSQGIRGGQGFGVGI